MRTPRRSVFLRAAEIVEGHDRNKRYNYACHAIKFAVDEIVEGETFRTAGGSPEFEFFVKVFKPDDKEPGQCWWEECIPDVELQICDKFNTQPRVYALLLCAEMLRR